MNQSDGICIGHITRERSLWFTHQGPQVWRCVNCAETNIDWYNWLVPWATWPWQCIYGLATTASAIKGSNAYLATVQTIVLVTVLSIECDTRHWWLWAAVFCQTLASSWHSEPLYYHLCVEKAAHTVAVSFSTQSQLQLLFFQLLTRHPIAPPTTNAVRPAN